MADLLPAAFDDVLVGIGKQLGQNIDGVQDRDQCGRAIVGFGFVYDGGAEALLDPALLDAGLIGFGQP